MPEKNFYDDLLNFVKWFSNSIYIMFLYLDLSILPFKVLIVFMCLNTISGVVKALRLDWKEFSFGVLIWGIISKFGILIIPLSVAYLSKGIGQDMAIGVEVIVKIITVSEFISFISNIYTIKTKVKLKDIDVFSILIHTIRNGSLLLIKKYTKLNIDAPTKEDKED